MACSSLFSPAFKQASLLGALVVSNVLTLALIVTNPVMAPLSGNSNVAALQAYEARIIQLRSAVDRLRWRETANRGSSALRLQDLSDMQQALGDQLAGIAMLSGKAAELGLQVTEASAALPTTRISGTGVGVAQLDLVETQLRAIEQDAELALDALAQAASRSADAIVAELQRLGPSASSAFGTGGPLLPINAGDDMSSKESEVLAALERLRAAKAAMDSTPVHRPLATMRVSSGYGTRKDPFTGESAFHSGIDFPAPNGTPIRSAAGGVVSFVGWKDGYGRVVEITHDSGLVTRYPHLSKALVAEGASIGADQQIALVGSTGRSTGPHLHFELRYGDRAIDPTPYLAAGSALERFHT